MTSVCRVLLVDDDDRFRRALEDLLADVEGLVVVGSVGDAGAAIEVATARAPDVAVVDVQMEGVGGAQLTRRLLSLAPRLRVLALSAAGDAASRASMQDAGAALYLVKPPQLHDLLAALTPPVAT